MDFSIISDFNGDGDHSSVMMVMMNHIVLKPMHWLCLSELKVVDVVVLGGCRVVLLPPDLLPVHLHLVPGLVGRVSHHLGILLGHPHQHVSLHGILVADHKEGAAADLVHLVK